MSVHAPAGRPAQRLAAVVLMAVLVVAAGLAPRWPVLLLPVAAGVFLLARRAAPPWVTVVVAGASVAGAVLSRALGSGSWTVLLVWVVATVLVVVLADGTGRLARARTRYREQGWQLAEALRGRERAATEAARTAERSRIAGEVHDSVGHDMALLAMQLAALQVEVRQGGLPAAGLESRLTSLRAAAAAATERLHETIGLLEPVAAGGGLAGSGPARTGTSWSSAVADLVQRVRAAGLAVDLHLDPATAAPALDRCPAVVGTTVLRVVEEATTNAAKHAPGRPLRVDVEVGAELVRVVATNPVGGRGTAAGGPPTDGSGRGLASLQERSRLLGGRAGARVDRGRFSLEVELPVRPVLATGARPEDPLEPTVVRRRSRAAVTRRWQSVLVLPAALLTGVLVLLVVAFVVLNLGSVLPRDRFAAIAVGQSQAVAEALLPPVPMPDAPETVPEPSADCRYHEERISFFERVTTFQVCFAGGRVVAAREISAGESR